MHRGKWGWMGRPYLCLIGGPALVAWREAGDVMCGKTGGPASPCCQCRRQGQLLEAARHPVSSLPSRSTSLSVAKSNSWDACAAPEALPHTTPRGLGAKPLTVAAPSPEGLPPPIWNLLGGRGKGMAPPALGSSPLLQKSGSCYPPVEGARRLCSLRSCFFTLFCGFLLCISQDLQITQLDYTQNRTR